MMFVMSYFWPLFGVLLATGAGLILLTEKPKWNDYLAFSFIVGTYITAWVILHPRQTPLMDDAKSVTALIGSGTPVLIEFQSPY
jgi:drug/metabolite transporter (DMT)-like permease